MLTRRWLILVLSATAIPALAASSYLSLFHSAKARADVRLTKQKARRALALKDYDRAYRLMSSRSISAEEYEQYRAAAVLSGLDVAIAELRAKQAGLALDLMRALDRNGRPIPLCRRIPLKEDDAVSRLLKRAPVKMTPAPEIPQGSGTRIQQQDVEATPPPAPETRPPETPEPPGTTEPAPGTRPGAGGEVEPPEPPQRPKPGASPAPSPAPKPGATPAPAPKPGGTAPAPKPPPKPAPRSTPR